VSAFDLNFWIGIAALVVAFAALLLALPPLLQMICGRPRVKIKFDVTTEQNAKFLLCAVYNLPIRQRLLKTLGVTRSPTEIFAAFDIREHGTKKIVASAFRARLRDVKSDTDGLAVTIRPTLPIIFTIVEQDDAGASTFNHAPSETRRVKLPPGEYFADVSIASDEMTVRKVAQSFTVAAVKDATDWSGRPLVEDW
jgi:hypothetical protein